MPKTSFIQNLVKDSVVYGLTRYLSVIAAIFLTPVYTRIIPRYDYGIMDIFNTWISFCVLLIPLGLLEAMPRLYAEAREDGRQFRRIIGNQNSLLIFSVLIFLFISYVARTAFESRILLSGDFGSIYSISMALIPLQVFVSQQMNFLRLDLRRRAYTTVSVLQFAILTILGFVLVYYYRMSILGFFWASLVATSLAALYSLMLNRRFLLLSLDPGELKVMVRYSLPLLYVVLFFSMSDIIDRYILNVYMDTRSVGLYSVAVRIASIPLFFTSAFATAWFPRIFSLTEIGEQKEAIKISHAAALVFFGSILTSVILFRKELILFFAPDYMDSFNVLVLLAISNTVNGLGPLYAFGIHLRKKSGDFVKAALLSIPVNIVLSIALVRNFGPLGVAFGTMAGTILWTFLRYHYGRKYIDVSFSFRPALYVIISVIAATLISHFLLPNAWLITLKVLLIIYPIILITRYLKSLYNELV